VWDNGVQNNKYKFLEIIMYKIIDKKKLSENITFMRVIAQDCASSCNAGQFFMLRINEFGERIPLTIFDWNRENGTIDFVFQEIGKSTKQLGCLNIGDSILDFVGPLGNPSMVKKYGKVVCVAGGLGIASMYPIQRELFKLGNEVISIIGARTKELIFEEDKLKKNTTSLYVCTDDGSYGQKGLVTDILKEICEKNNDVKMVFAVGPVPMMKAVANTAKNFNITTRISLDAIMLDGVGMCGTCRVDIGGKIYFACVDGPEFNSDGVNFNELSLRQKRFSDIEKQSLELFKNKRNGDCKCKKEK
jgi:ferredoxin/flavodoxin---NADP+ reductase